MNTRFRGRSHGVETDCPVLGGSSDVRLSVIVESCCGLGDGVERAISLCFNVVFVKPILLRLTEPAQVLCELVSHAKSCCLGRELTRLRLCNPVGKQGVKDVFYVLLFWHGR